MLNTVKYVVDSFDGQHRWGKVVQYKDGDTIENVDGNQVPFELKEHNNSYERKQRLITDLSNQLTNVSIDNNKSDFTTYELYNTGIHLRTNEGELSANPTQLREPPGQRQFTLLMVKGDTLQVAEAIQSDDLIILDFANAVDVGGGFRYGAQAQEEMIFYRSTYYHSLNNAHGKLKEQGRLVATDFDNKIVKKPKYLPFNRCIVSRSVYVFGRLQNQTITYQRQYFMRVCMIAAAAPCFIRQKFATQHIINGQFDETTKDALTTMWTTIFMTSIACGKKSILIGPIGCGSFAPKIHPNVYKRLVADTLCEVLTKYGNYFHTVIFVDHGDNNFQTFNSSFENNNFQPRMVDLTNLSQEVSKLVPLKSSTVPQGLGLVPVPIVNKHSSPNQSTQQTSQSNTDPRTNSSQTAPSTNQTPKKQFRSTRQLQVLRPITRASQPTSAYLLFAAFVSTFIVSTIRVSMV